MISERGRLMIRKGVVTLDKLQAIVAVENARFNRLICKDVAHMSNESEEIIIWRDEFGNVTHGVKFHKSTYARLPEALNGLKYMNIPGNRGWYSSNGTPQAILEYYIMHNNLTNIEVDADLKSNHVHTVWYNTDEVCGLYISIVRYKDDPCAMLEFWRVNDGKLSLACKIPYKIMYGMLTGNSLE